MHDPLTAEKALAEMGVWRNLDEERLAEYRNLVTERGDDALFKGAFPEHLTSSLFVFNASCTKILLTLHTKGQFWVQFGGHIEAWDKSLAHAALREGIEESGIEDLELLSINPADLDVHELGGGFGSVCREHWDIGYVAIVPDGTEPVRSEESDDVAWFDVDALPENAAANMLPRISLALALAETHDDVEVED